MPWLGEGRAAFLDEVRGWVAGALDERVGELESVGEQPWSIVMRAPTRLGPVYFKAAAPGGRQEPELVTLLAQEWSDRVPTPLAVDPKRGWMLLPDHGPTLREVLDGADSIEVWKRLLPLYAELQLGSSREPGRWLAAGVPDRRLERLPQLLEELVSDDAAVSAGHPEGLTESERDAVRGLMPELESQCRELGALPFAAALEHGDLHDGNVLTGNGRYWIFDWGDTSLTHPFCSLLVTCRSAIDDLTSEDGQQRAGRMIDAYLEPWQSFAPSRELRPLVEFAFRVGHVSRALDWNHVLAGTGGPERAEWQTRVALWLRAWVERQDLLRVRV